MKRSWSVGHNQMWGGSVSSNTFICPVLVTQAIDLELWKLVLINSNL